MKLNRYRLPCHTCEGKGSYDGPEDNEGYRPREECRWCYRGSVTIVLTDQDERSLYEQLKAKLEGHK